MEATRARRGHAIPDDLHLSIPAVFLYGPILSDPAYILSAGADSQVLLGALFDLITALACIGTAVALYPVIKRQSSAASIGFVATRIFEAAVIVVGVGASWPW